MSKKKQLITRQDIERDLLARINKRKPLIIFLTVIILLAVLSSLICVIKYINGEVFESTGSSDHMLLSPTATMILTAFSFLFLVIVVLHYYYIDLYKIKTGRFRIIDDTLYHKEKEWIKYYRNSQLENSLYFHYGRIAVDDKVYSYSDIGDAFYVVVLNEKKTPRMAYHKSYYEIEKTQK